MAWTGLRDGNGNEPAAGSLRVGGILFRRDVELLARSRGITLAELLAANPQIADPDRVRAGQLVYLPARPEPSP